MLVTRRADEEDQYWFPVMMGIVTRAEVEVADMSDLQFYNELAERKYKLLNGGGAVE